MLNNVLFNLLAGPVLLALIWTAAAWMLVKLVKLESPTGRFVVFLVPLVAAFAARVRLSTTMTTEVVLVCLVVAVLLLGRDAAQYRAFRKRIEAAAEPSEGLQKAADGLAASFGIRSPRVLVTGDSSLAPFTGGIKNPFIVIPRPVLSALSEEELTVLLAHEMAHIRRRDLLWKWILLFFRRLSFLNPVVALPYRWLSLEMERVCDRTASAVTQKPGTMARMLLKIEEFLSQASAGSASRLPESLSGAGSFLSLRIAHLAEAPRATNGWASLLKVGAIFVAFKFICFKPAEIWLRYLSP